MRKIIFSFVLLLFGILFNSSVGEMKQEIPHATENIVIQKNYFNNKQLDIYKDGVIVQSIKYHKQYYYTKSRLKVRKEPNFNGKHLSLLSQYKKVLIVGKYNDKWKIIRINKGYYFVCSKYLMKNKPLSLIIKKASLLKGVRKQRADRIAKVCIKKYKKYGVLPSVCIAQAFIETGIGTAYNNGNLWGICSNGYSGFASIEVGCLKYLQVINNGCYRGAPFASNYRLQISRIIHGGYCVPANNYISNAIHTIQKYHLTDYDKGVNYGK